MDTDVQKILDMVGWMQESLISLDARKTFNPDQKKAISDASNGMRFYRDVYMSNLRAAFDPDYKAELEKMTVKVKGKLKVGLGNDTKSS